MNPLLLLAIGVPIALLLIYWFSRRSEGFGDGIALLCLLAACPCIDAHTSIMDMNAYVQNLLPKPKTQGVKDETFHRKAFAVIVDMVAAGVGSIIIAADSYMAYVFNSSLFGTHEVILSSGIFEWAASLLWVATPAMWGLVALECAGIVKTSGMFPELGKPARWIVGIISFVLMCLSILLVTYAYEFRGVKIFDPTNTWQAAQMGEGILNGLGLLIAAASIPSLVAIMNGISTLLTILLFVLLIICLVIGKTLRAVAHVLDVYCLVLTEGEWSVFIVVDKPLKVIAREFQFHQHRGRRWVPVEQAANTSKELSPPVETEQVITPTLPRVIPDEQLVEPETEPLASDTLAPLHPKPAPVEEENGQKDTDLGELSKKKVL